MTHEEIEKLVQMNIRMSMLLGVATNFIFEYGKTLPENGKEQYRWFLNAIDNLFYLDKPLPPMPTCK